MECLSENISGRGGAGGLLAGKVCQETISNSSFVANTGMAISATMDTLCRYITLGFKLLEGSNFPLLM